MNFYLIFVFSVLLEALEREAGHLKPEPAEDASLLTLFSLLLDRFKSVWCRG